MNVECWRWRYGFNYALRGGARPNADKAVTASGAPQPPSTTLALKILDEKGLMFLDNSSKFLYPI